MRPSVFRFADGLGDFGFELVAQGHELVSLGDNAQLTFKGGRTKMAKYLPMKNAEQIAASQCYGPIFGPETDSIEFSRLTFYHDTI